MESFLTWFAGTFGKYISKEVLVFIISMIPILECRGGLIMAALLKVNIFTAVPLCILGNIIPIPFILLFIRKIFAWLKRFKKFKPLIEKLENRAMNKSDSMKNGEYLGLLLFVGIPLPGTGGWTGALISSLLEMDIKKSSITIFFGILLATVIVGSLSYGLLSFL